MNKIKINFKYLYIGMAVLLVAGLMVLQKAKFSSSANVSDPEKFLTDLSGKSRTTFAPDESGYLTLRAYGEKIPGSYAKASVVLVLDTSGSMSGTKLAALKTATKNFIDSVDVSKDTRLGMVSYNTTASTLSPIVKVTSGNKTSLKALVDGLSSSGGTCIGCGTNISNTLLIAEAAGRNKYQILFSDGEETTAPWINGTSFINEVTDLDTPVIAGTPLDNMIKAGIKSYTIKLGACGGESNPSYSRNCPLMRFISARTNNVQVPDEFLNWSHTYDQKINGVNNGIDENIFYLSPTTAELSGIYARILNNIQAQTLTLNVYEKLAEQALFENVVSVKDKAGNNKAYTLDQTSDRLKFTIAGINNSDDNFVDIKLKIKMKSNGFFDLDSNYTNCSSGNPTKVADVSKVDYLNTSTTPPTVLDSKTFPAFCVNVSLNNPNIIKTTFSKDPGNDIPADSSDKKATYEAGGEVWTVIQVYESTASRSDFVIKDKVPETASNFRYWVKRPGDSVFKDIVSSKVTINDNYLSFTKSAIGNLTYGMTFIKYKYKI